MCSRVVPESDETFWQLAPRPSTWVAHGVTTMAEPTWSGAVEQVRPHIVRILTPEGSGTGFLVSNGQNNTMCGIATAAHVVRHAHFWEQPIHIYHAESQRSVVIRRHERVIFLDMERDTAAIVLDRGDLEFPPDPLPLTPSGMFLRVGSKIGWLGFPAVQHANLCFFAGHVSAWVEDLSAYLVDGVAINGVSGGPAFSLSSAGSVSIIGVVSAYVPNRATGETLPGLSIVKDVAQFQEFLPAFRSLDQAREAEPSEAEMPEPEDSQSEGARAMYRSQ